MAEKTNTRKSSAQSKTPNKNSRTRMTARTDAAPVDVTPERLRQTRARLVHLTDAYIAALDGRHTDAQRDAEGSRTRANDTLADGCVMLVVAEEEVRAHGDKIRCTPEYLSYVNLTIERLQAAMAADASDAGDPIRTREQAERVARAERKALVAQLSRIAGKATRERASLTSAIGSGDTRAEVMQSLGQVVTLGRAWRASSDPSLEARCAIFQLTDAALDQAARAQRTLVDAGGDAIGVRNLSHDTPMVNRAEGAVLLELKTLAEIFDEAHEKDPTVRKLPIGHAGTRNHLHPHAATDTASPGVTPGSPADAKPATG